MPSTPLSSPSPATVSSICAMEPILLRLQRPMAANLRREAVRLGTAAGIERHERLLTALESDDPAVVVRALDEHGGRRFLSSDSPVNQMAAGAAR